MPRVASSHGASRSLLLGLIGLGGASFVLWLRLAQAPREGAEASVGAASPELAPFELAPSDRAPGQPGELLGPGLREARLPGAMDVPPTLPEDPRAIAVALRAPRAEREFLAGFHTLARAQPGALEERAAEILGGTVPGGAVTEGVVTDVEKVALLRALLECRSPEAVTWLARSVRTQPDESRAEARSVASQALAMLAGEAPREESARRALASLAFEEPELALGLRRRAASAFARHCAEDELDGLRNRLLREPDALLVAGALASLSEREPTPRVERIRLDFPAAPAPQPEE